MLDNTHQVETPEGIELSLEVAGLLPRACAYMIDWLIFLALLFAIILATSPFGDFGSGLFLILFFIIYWLYPVLFEVFRGGQTPGKKIMGLKAIHQDGTPISLNASFIRNLLLIADFLPFFYTTAFISMLFNSNFKRLGDLAAGTLIVYADKFTEEEPLPEQGSKAPLITLTLEEQRSILSLAERHKKLSQARQQELADLLPQDMFAKEKSSRLSQLHGFANWLRGH